jgi:hypothetical protein
MFSDFMNVIGAEQAAIADASFRGHVIASYAVKNPQCAKAVVLVGAIGQIPLASEARGRV